MKENKMSMDAIVGMGAACGGRWVVPSELGTARPSRFNRRVRTDAMAAACILTLLLAVATLSWSLDSFERDCQRPFKAFLYTDRTPGEARAHLDQVLVCFEARGLTDGPLPSLLNSEGEDIGALYRSMRVVRLAFPSDPRQAGAAEAWLRTARDPSVSPDLDRRSLDSVLSLGDLTPLFQVYAAMGLLLSAYLIFEGFERPDWRL